MPIWSNTDAPTSKPKFPVQRQTREVVQLTVANGGGNTSGNNIITFTYYDGTASSNLSNVISVGQWVYGTNVSANGVANFFKSNNTVSSITGNTVVLTNALFGTVVNAAIIEVDKAISYNASKTAASNTWNDTILVTDSRLANTANGGYPNTAYAFGNLNSGWNKITKKVNNDGTVRYLRETLVVLATPTAANVNSANTSWGQAYKGL
jgi:anaerobic glycerol-3-phosphate dehydrogenase